MPTADAKSKRMQELEARLATLPAVVQQAIKKAGITEHMQELAKKRKLHVDKWESLEYEVMRTLLGDAEARELAENIEKNVRLSEEESRAIATEVSLSIFDPVREELERLLDNPDAEAQKEDGVGEMRTQALATERTPQAAPAVQPATPPAPPPEGKAVRAPIAEVYKPGESSAMRKVVKDDPYREPPA